MPNPIRLPPGIREIAVTTPIEHKNMSLRVRAKINSGFAGGIMTLWRGTNDLPAPKPPAATSAAQARGSGEASEHTLPVCDE